MLRYMGWGEAADLIVKGMEGAVAAKTVTYDFARLMDGAKEIKCSEFGDAIINWMDKEIPAPKVVAAKTAPVKKTVKKAAKSVKKVAKKATKKVVAATSSKGKKPAAKKPVKKAGKKK